MPSLYPSTPSSLLPIIISGTGPAALLLAQALRSSSVPNPIRIFERDASLHQRAQGYRFKITNEGVTACRSALGSEHFALLRATAAKNNAKPIMRLDAKTGTGMALPMFNTPDREVEEPLAVDRAVLRRVLFRGLEDMTTFGTGVVGFGDARPTERAEEPHGVEATDSSSSNSPAVEVHLSDGSSMPAALLIGADGASSTIRSKLSPSSTLLDTELRMIYGKTPLSGAFRTAFEGLPNLSVEDDLVGTFALIADPAPRDAPLFMMYDSMLWSNNEPTAANPLETNELREMAVPKDYLYWAMALRSDAPEVARVEPWHRMSSTDAATFTRDMSADWHPSLRALLEHQDETETSALRSGVMQLPLVDWRGDAAAEDGSPMVTLIGDAAHAMPPTGGVGATLACQDAVRLVEELEKYGVTREALQEYESKMRAYVTPHVEGSVKTGKKLVGMRTMAELKPMTAWAS